MRRGIEATGPLQRSCGFLFHRLHFNESNALTTTKIAYVENVWIHFPHKLAEIF